MTYSDYFSFKIGPYILHGIGLLAGVSSGLLCLLSLVVAL